MRWVTEHDDLTALNATEVVAQLRNKDSILDLKGVLHRAGRNEERLRDERADEKRQQQCHNDDDEELSSE
jgi:hypothetical protein